jgi:hypothetical protein
LRSPDGLSCPIEKPLPECWRRVIVAGRGRKSSASGTHLATEARSERPFAVDKADEVILNSLEIA